MPENSLGRRHLYLLVRYLSAADSVRVAPDRLKVAGTMNELGLSWGE